MPEKTLLAFADDGEGIGAMPLDGGKAEAVLADFPAAGVNDDTRAANLQRSGVRGVSGISGDLRQVLEAADRGSSHAPLAYERFVLSIRRALGAMAGVLGGVDAVVFTGGIGENSARVRRDATRALRIAGLELAEDADASSNADRDIAAPGSRVHVLVLRAREDLAILKEMLRLRGRADTGRAAERVEGSS